MTRSERRRSFGLPAIVRGKRIEDYRDLGRRWYLHICPDSGFLCLYIRNGGKVKRFDPGVTWRDAFIHAIP